MALVYGASPGKSLVCHTQGFYGNTILFMLNGGSKPMPREDNHLAPNSNWLWDVKLGPLPATADNHVKIYNNHGLHKLLLDEIRLLLDVTCPIVWCTSSNERFIQFVADRISKINKEDYKVSLDTVTNNVLLERLAFEQLSDTYNILELDIDLLLMKRSSTEYNKLLKHTGIK
jgi:hypothetical protein